MPPPVVAFAHFVRRLNFSAENCVDERRFSNAGRTEKRSRAAGANNFLQLYDSVAADDTRGNSSHAQCGFFCFPAKLGNVFAEIGFVQNDDWTGAAFPRKCQIPFYAARVEFAVERTDKQNRVDIRRDDLLLRFLAGGLAREFAVPVENKMDCRARFVLFN